MNDPDCLFCKIVAGDVPADVVAESDTAIAFRDIAPQAPVHVQVIPRDHCQNVAELAASGDVDVADLFRLASEVAAIEGVAETGYRLVANTGAHAFQTVPHAHVHVLGGRPMGWPPG
ncbi:MAG TPA: histidine triad nucleotide-binding protein [Mycobacteriales bacterium]|nr:histidine triad nucleotide-binding protein [Mycobacteriales bacterium]